MGCDVVESDLLQQPDASHRGINVGDGRRAGLETTRRGRQFQMLYIKGERVRLSEPACNRRLKRLNQLLAHVQKGQAGCPSRYFSVPVT